MPIAGNPDAPGGLPARLLRALPPPGVALGGAILWALIMATSALADLLVHGWQTPAKIRFVTLLFALGGGIAFPLGIYCARLFAPGPRGETAFAAAFVFLLAATIGATGGIFALQYRLYYAEWHADAFTKMWANEFVFTILAALYQFAVLGVRLYFPIGFAALVAVSMWFARQPR